MSRPTVATVCIWLLRIVGALATPISVALACRWRSRPQHQKQTCKAWDSRYFDGSIDRQLTRAPTETGDRGAGTAVGRKSTEPNYPLQGSAPYADAWTENALLTPDIAAPCGARTGFFGHDIRGRGPAELR